MSSEESADPGPGDTASPGAGTLFIVSAPSGAGKTTLTRGLLEAEPGLAFSVSTTTRAMRPGEIEGRDYFYVSVAEFQELVANDAFLEHAFVHGNHYGTRRETVERALAAGRDLLLDIDVQGAAQVREARRRAADHGLPFFRCVSIFILPPSLEALERRLRDRRTNDEDDIRRRLERAGVEMQRAGEYDAVIVNDDAIAATERLVALYRADRAARMGAPR